MPSSWELRSRAQTLGNLSSITRSVGGVAGAIDDAFRVKEVNSWLPILEEYWQNQYEQFPQKSFEVFPEYVPGTNLANPQALAPSLKKLGELQYSDVLKEHHKAVTAMEENIRANVHNKSAQSELLQHLSMSAVQQQGRLLGQWQKAAGAHALAGVENVANTVTGTAEQKSNKLRLRLAETVAAGWMDQLEAESYFTAKQKQYQYVEAYNGTLNAMTAEGVEAGKGLEAGEKYLKEKTPYWDSNPEAREKVLQEVTQKYNAYLEARAKEQDTIFSEKYTKADTVGQLDALMDELDANTLMRGTQKKTWEQWIVDKRERVIKAEAEGAGPIGDVVSSLYSRMYGAADRNKNPGLEVTIKEIDETVKDPEKHQALLAKRNELQKSHEEGGQSTKEDVFYEAYRVANDPYMSEQAKNAWIDKHALQGGGLSPEDAMKVRGWVKPYNDNPKRKEAMDAVGQAYRLSMANPNISTAGKKKLALELYNAEVKLGQMFENPKTTNADIDAAVTSFLEGKAIEDIKTVLLQATGGAGFPFAGTKAGTARELETAREYGLFTQFPKKGTEFETTYRPIALEQERSALAKAKIAFVSQAQNVFGDQEYTASDGNKYVVRQTKVDGKMVERVYKVLTRMMNGKTQIGYELVAGQ